MTPLSAGRSRPLDLGLAVLAVGVATLARAGLFALFGPTVPYLTFLPAVIVSTLLGGREAGWLATLLAAAASLGWVGPLETANAIEGAAAGLVLFVAVSLWMVWLCARVRDAAAQHHAADETRLRLAAIVETSDDAMLSKSLDGVIRTWNAAAVRVYGYPADRIVGRPIADLVPEGLRPEQALVSERLRRGERVEPFETIRLRADGQPVRVLVTISPLRNEAGETVGAVEIARDVSERVRAEAQLRRARSTAELNAAQLRAVIGAMSEGVILADADGNLLDWNAAALRIHGYADLADVRRGLSDIAEEYEISDEHGPLDMTEWPMSRVLRGQAFEQLELSVRRRDVPIDLVLDYSGTPVYNADGTMALAVLTLHDVTEERRAQHEVRENARRLELVMAAGGLGDWEWDAESDLVTLSPAAERLFGMPPGQQLTREAMRGLLHESDRERARRTNDAATAGGGEYDIEYRLRRPDGRLVWIATKGRGEFDAAGRLTRMLGVVQDVTARKRAEEAIRDSREWLELAVSIALMGTFRLDVVDRGLALNDTGRAVYGFAPDEPLTFDGVTARFHPDDAAAVTAHVRSALDPQGPRRFETEHRIVRTDGQVRWIRVRGRGLFEDAPDNGALTDGAPADVPAAQRAVRCVGTFIDVTEGKLAEQQREAVLAAEQDARAAAEHAGRMKDEFLSTLSHELRTPLNAILGWSQILRAGPPDAADVRQGLEVIERNARAQAQIIEDLLDMSRIINGKVRLETGPLDVPALVAVAIDTVRPTAAAKGVVLDSRVKPPRGPVSGDAGRIGQVLWNLLSNAIKFTPPGGRVTLALMPTDTGVRIEVGDTGEGIAADFLPHVFDRFRQADASTTRRHGGLGLGLSIVRQLVELHGGTVRAESDGAGRGSTFIVTLPDTAAAPTDSEPEPAATPARPRVAHTPSDVLTGVRVLLVDDEPDARAVVRRLLEDCRATVVTAGSADEAMRLLDAGDLPNVLVSDIGMPGEDGYALIRHVRERASPEELPAVALTAYARPEDAARAIAAGFQAHLTKPAEPARLVSAVAALVGKSLTA